jgi:uncharacterized protein YlxP (DUF503 family)
VKFFIGIGRYRLDLAHCRSLKDKRQVVKSLLDRLGKKRSMSASEVGDNDFWKTGVIAVTCVSNRYGAADETLAGARRLIESMGVEVLESDHWVLSPDDLQVRLDV